MEIPLIWRAVGVGVDMEVVEEEVREGHGAAEVAEALKPAVREEIPAFGVEAVREAKVMPVVHRPVGPREVTAEPPEPEVV